MLIISWLAAASEWPCIMRRAGVPFLPEYQTDDTSKPCYA